MMGLNQGSFRRSDLRKADFQYAVRHTDVKEFAFEEEVFLKSNPEHLMTMYSCGKSGVICGWDLENGKINVATFPPECILQYRYAGLLIWRDSFNVCLN